MAGNKDIPVFVKIAEQLRQKISQQGYAPGALLPQEVELAGMFNVSRSTLRNAMAILEKDGWIIRKKRLGTVVAPDALRRKYRKIDIGFFFRCSLTNYQEYLYLFQNNLQMGYVLRQAIKRGYFVRFFPWGVCNVDNRQYDLEEILLRKQVDAFVVSNPAYLTDVVDRLRSCRLPHIALETHIDKPGVNSFVFDDEYAIRLLMGKLHDLGHRKIGFLGGVLKKAELCGRARRHLCYFVKIAAEFGMTIKDEWIFCTGAEEVRNVPAPIGEFSTELLLCREKPTAVFCMSPADGAVFMQIAKQMGIRVPDDISLVYTQEQIDEPENILADISGINYRMDFFADAVLDELLLNLRQPSYRAKCHTMKGEFNPGKTLKALN
ncbi:MAG: GntR family transcriptional regulator [Lentisphaerae bacterium]|nr:GntR family transcriptional regulator [Lentisphaerota bacterium]